MNEPKPAVEFYQSHLDRVSRSFAACIARLETPLRAWVSLTYLLCRILDTVEDAVWPRREVQARSFETFRQLVGQEISPEVESVMLDGWVREFPPTLPEGERLLLNDTGLILRDLRTAPEEIRVAILTLVNSMSAGMRHFCARNELRLSCLSEVNQYCFFVAGLVGETLSKLLRAIDHRLELRRELIVDAHHFGLFLQKVNLLKDQSRDEREGRFLVPSRAELLTSLALNAQGAMRYIEAIPLDHKDYRVFCAWSLFLGLATLPLFQRESVGVVKLPRETTAKLFQQIENWVDTPTVLREQFEKLLNAAHSESAESRQAAANRIGSSRTNWQWVPEVYKGILMPDDLCALGLGTADS